MTATLVLKITFDNVDPTLTDPEVVGEWVMDAVIEEMNNAQFPYNYETWSAEWAQ